MQIKRIYWFNHDFLGSFFCLIFVIKGVAGVGGGGLEVFRGVPSLLLDFTDTRLLNDYEMA